MIKKYLYNVILKKMKMVSITEMKETPILCKSSVYKNATIITEKRDIILKED